MFGEKGGPRSAISAYEDVGQRPTQWWADEGLYMGFKVAAPADENHPLRGDWICDGTRGNYRGDRHILTIGPNGSGKTRRLLFPNLHYLKGWSVVAIDPKGELFAHTAPERAKTSKIKLFDPFGVVKKTYPNLAAKLADGKQGFTCESLGFNPIAALKPFMLDAAGKPLLDEKGKPRKNPRFVDDAKALAVSLIRTEGERDKYWSQAAQALVKGLVMALRLEAGEQNDASLAHLRRVLGKTPKNMANMIAGYINDHGAAHHEVAASLSEFATYSADDRELGGIRRQAKVQTDWLDSGEVAADLSKANDSDFATLKATPTTIYLVLPPEYLASHGTWLRLMVTAILRPLLREVDAASDKLPVPCLFMLDEFAQLGKMEIIEDNYALMRGYGVKLWTIWQDLNQAKILYKDRWESFISNAGIVQSFAPQDMTTRKYLSQLADDRMTWHKRDGESVSFSLSKGGANLNTGSSKSDANIKEPLIYPYELGQMRQGWGVVFTQRGEVHRRYFPDATHEAFDGVRDMMTQAKRNLAP